MRPYAFMQRPGWRSRVASAALAACLGAAAGGAGVPAPASASAPEVESPSLTPEREEALHDGMLEVRERERNGDRAGAIRRAEALLKDFPGNRRVEEALLGMYRLERRNDAMVKLLRQRIQRDPNDLESARELATSYLIANDQRAALDVLHRLVEANRSDENRYRLAVGLLRSRGLLDPAVQMYRDGRKAIGRETLFAAELAQLEEERGDYAAAIGEYLLLLADPDRHVRAQREIAKLLERAPEPNRMLMRIEEMRSRHLKSPGVHDVAATAYLQAGRLEDAFGAVRDADHCANDQGEYLLDFGRNLLQPNPPVRLDPRRAQIALQALQLLAERHPQSNLLPEASKVTAEGLVSVARGMPDGEPRRKLLQQALSALDAQPGRQLPGELQHEALALKGMILYEDLGQPAEALEVFQKLAAGDMGPQQQVLQVQMALCYAAMGKLDEARRVLEKVAVTAGEGEVPPGFTPRPGQRPNGDIGTARARYYVAVLDLIAGEYDKARTGFATVAELVPQDRLANDCLDLALTISEAQGDDPAALKRFASYRRALLLRDRAAVHAELEGLVREFPKSTLSPVALFELAAALGDDRRFPEALTQYQEVLAQHPKHRLAPRALEAIGDLQLQRLNHPELAVASYERLLTEYGDDLFLDDVRKKLLTAREATKGDTHATP